MQLILSGDRAIFTSRSAGLSFFLGVLGLLSCHGSQGGPPTGLRKERFCQPLSLAIQGTQFPLPVCSVVSANGLQAFGLHLAFTASRLSDLIQIRVRACRDSNAREVVENTGSGSAKATTTNTRHHLPIFPTLCDIC